MINSNQQDPSEASLLSQSSSGSASTAEMDESAAASSLRLVIKVANHKFEDLKIDCNQAWSVLDLKQFLNREYPFKPEVKGQRLIYSGQLLKDAQLVREVVDISEESPYIFHLVYMNNKHSTSLFGNSNTKSSTTASASSGSNPPPSSATTTSANESRSRTEPNIRDSSPEAASSGGDSFAGTEPIVMPSSQEVNYVRAYNLMMADYYHDMSQRYTMSALNGTSLQDQEAFFRTLSFRPAPINYASGDAPQVRVFIRQTNPEQNTGPLRNLQNLVHNFQRARRVFNDRDMFRDALTFLKALLMSTMIVFYSSSNRLLIVLGLGFLVYLHQQFRRVQPVVAQQQQQRQQQQQQQQQPPLNDNNNNNAPEPQRNQPEVNVNENNNNRASQPEAEARSSTPSPTPTPIPESESGLQQRQSRFRMFVDIVSSIFTSLIPEPPNMNQ